LTGVIKTTVSPKSRVRPFAYRRDASIVCVVAEAKDEYAIERTGAFKGRYHVLGGLISPMDGIGPAQLKAAISTTPPKSPSPKL